MLVKRDSRRASEEMPRAFLSTPHASMHSSVSIQSLSLSASISDVRHVYPSSPLLRRCFSSTQRFPLLDIAKAHESSFKFSHAISPAWIKKKKIISSVEPTEILLFCTYKFNRSPLSSAKINTRNEVYTMCY